MLLMDAYIKNVKMRRMYLAFYWNAITFAIIIFFLDGNFQALQIDSAVTKSLDLEDVDRYIFLLFQLT